MSNKKNSSKHQPSNLAIINADINKLVRTAYSEEPIHISIIFNGETKTLSFHFENDDYENPKKAIIYDGLKDEYCLDDEDSYFDYAAHILGSNLFDRIKEHIAKLALKSNKLDNDYSIILNVKSAPFVSFALRTPFMCGLVCSNPYDISKTGLNRSRLNSNIESIPIPDSGFELLSEEQLDKDWASKTEYSYSIIFDSLDNYEESGYSYNSDGLSIYVARYVDMKPNS